MSLTKHSDRTITQNGCTYELEERSDGIQRSLHVKADGVYIGCVWTNRWGPTVYAYDGDAGPVRWKMDREDWFSKDRIFTEMRNRIIAAHTHAGEVMETT